MPMVAFTQNIQRHVQCPPTDAPGALDDQGVLRKHMVVFVNGNAIGDRATLSDPVPKDAEVYVMQALSPADNRDAPMSERMYVATRKGLFQLDRKKQKPGWEIGRTAFIGDNVSQVLADPRNERMFATLDHGHWGVKLHRSTDGGDTWEECNAPALPERPPESQRNPA